MGAFLVEVSFIFYNLQIGVMLGGFYLAIRSQHLLKKLIGLGMMQTAVLLFLVSLGYVKNGRPPVLSEAYLPNAVLDANPLLHAMVLTGIVVGVTVLAVGMALVIRIRADDEKKEKPPILP